MTTWDAGNVSVTTSVQEQMKSKKLIHRIELGENVYSLLVVAPIISYSFIFSMGIVATKLVVLGILSSDINFEDAEPPEPIQTLLKFFLVPVAIAMQEDLIESIYAMTNGKWDKSLLDHSKQATESKFYFGYILRLIDGLLSLYVNYVVMLTTNETIDIFLNFAALQFLYAIDDVFYELITLGFFGDRMEHMTIVVENCSLSCRHGITNRIGRFRITWLDTVCFFFMLLVLYIGFGVWTVRIYDINIIRNVF